MSVSLLLYAQKFAFGSFSFKKIPGVKLPYGSARDPFPDPLSANTVRLHALRTLSTQSWL